MVLIARSVRPDDLIRKLEFWQSSFEQTAVKVSINKIKAD